MPAKQDITQSPAAHAESVAQALSRLTSMETGLSASEAADRLISLGRNELPKPRRRGALRRFLAQFNNVLIGFLIVSSMVAFALNHVLDASVILAVVIINATVGFVQEGRAERALEAIRDMILPRATALRDGHRISVDATDLVPGDVVLLEPGDQVPADLRLLRARGLRIDESLLTGESVPVDKGVAPVPADAALGDRSCMAHSGTMAVAGQGYGLVVATGGATEIGQISALVGGVRTLTTPLLRRINRFGRRMTGLTIALSVVVFLVFTQVHGNDWDEALLVVVALAVGLVPEELPAVITIALAIGVQRMAARRAIVRRLPAVETLGSTTVICTDKTGTLTRNEMAVGRVIAGRTEVEVDGDGLASTGRFLSEGAALSGLPDAADALVTCALICNDAQLRGEGPDRHAEGDPMEAALLALGLKAGQDPDAVRADWPRHDTVPFDANHRFMAVLACGPDGIGTIFVKGAPERLLELSSHEALGATEPPVDRDWWADRIADAAGRGERVLGFAVRPEQDLCDIDVADVDGGLLFLGIVALVDPPRAEARDAIAECHSAGIDVKMITGDHGATAAAIAAELGMGARAVVVTGADLEAVDDADLPELAQRTTVFARATSAHKLRIVRALQSTGGIVAMTGDGVNDAPALKAADVGVAMGVKGTEASKQAAQMVLADDNFATIVAAVREGRTVFDNIRKVIAWTLPTNMGEALIIVLAVALGLTIPMTAVQILWVNMIPTVTLGLVLAVEAMEPGIMRRPPRRPDAALLSWFLIWQIGFVSAAFLAGTFGVFFWSLSRGDDVETARTLVVNTLVMMEIFYLMNVRFMARGVLARRDGPLSLAVVGAVGAVLFGQALLTYLPVLNTLFQTRPLPPEHLMVILGVGVAFWALCEAELAFMRRTGLMQRWQD